MADSMRSLNSFGVAGLLSQQGEVFYSNDLRARNIGRIADLVCAKFRERETDELRLRSLLTYGLFLAYAVRGLPSRHSEELSAVSTEIGVDGDYLAVGVSFHWEGSRPPKFPGLGERLALGDSTDPFERILKRMEVHSTQLLVRYELKERRIEVVALVNRVDSGLQDPLMVIPVDSNTAPLLEVSNYVELGDLDYTKLLKTPTLADDIDAENEEAPEVITVGGGEAAQPEGEAVVVSGKLGEEEEEFRFTTEQPGAEAEELRAMVADYERMVGELRGTIEELRKKVATEVEKTIISGSGEEKKGEEWGLGFLKQLNPFAKKEEEKIVVKGGPAAAVDQTPIVVSGGATEVPVDPSEISGGGEKESLDALQELKAIASQKKSAQMEATFSEIREEVEENKAKKWVDALSSELLQEKARLTELQKNLAKQIRQKELEFKTATSALEQELKRKDGELRQKDSAIEAKNEQIAQLNLAVERASSSNTDKEQQQLKVRLDRAQKIAQMKEEESKSLVAKMRDLENRLIIAQAKAQKGNELQMQTKVQGLEKKIEEYKRINQRLMESMNAQKDKSSDKELGDLRRKIDQLDRQMNDAKRNLEKSNFKVRELQDTERKLQADLARAVEENRNLRKSQARGNGGTGGAAGGESGGQAA